MRLSAVATFAINSISPVALEDADAIASLHVPQTAGLVRRARGQVVPIGMKFHALDTPGAKEEKQSINDLGVRLISGLAQTYIDVTEMSAEYSQREDLFCAPHPRCSIV